MIDIKFIRDNPQAVKQNIANRRVDPKKADIDKLLELDSHRSKLMVQIQDIRARRNQLNDELKDTKSRTQDKINEGKQIREQLENLEADLTKIEVQWQEFMDWIPNMLAPDVPVGKDENDDPEVKAWTPKDGYFP